MSAFLFLLVKLNLAMGMAVILVALLRRPLRELFGAPIAYAIWLVVPVAGLAVLLPPRAAPPAPQPAPFTTVHVPVLSISSVIDHIAPSALTASEQLTGQEALARHAMATAAPAAPLYGLPDTALLLLAAWVVGALVMVAYLTHSQLRFAAAVRSGKAGPAVLGFLRPRIVTPDGFQQHFTPQEQAAILAHERVHLARQDARINALAALLRCMWWFNPLIHLGARWLRIDQELACDASVVATSVSRRDYAEALLKSQMAVTVLPLGCNWPGAQHPLVERIALLKRRRPGLVRRVLGTCLVLLAAGSAGLGAWAAQPPVSATPVAAPLPRMAALSAPNIEPVAAPAQTVERPSVKPVSSGQAIDAPSTDRTARAISLVPVRVQMPNSGNIAAPVQPTLAEMPSISVALNSTGKQLTPPSDIGSKDVLVANTPSGDGDPDTIVCRAPQRFAGSDQFGPEACGRNYEWRKLAMNGKDVAPDGKTLIDRPAAATTPSGVGDPEKLVCRAPQRFAGSDRLGPEACGHNWEWLTMALNGKELAADGKTLIDKPTAANPTGEGDPAAVTCRTPKSAMYAPVCQTNRFWADLIRNHQTIDKATVDNPTGEGDPEAVTCRTPKFVWHGPLVEICRTNRFWADVAKNHQFVDANGAVFGRPPTPAHADFSDIPYGPGAAYIGGDVVYNHGYASYPGHDSGRAWQSSEPNPGGTLPGQTAASTPTFHGYSGGISPCGGCGAVGGGGGGGGGTPTFGGYHP